MADGTPIEWSDATWNIITGCSVVSPGCTNCYAMKLAGGKRAIASHPSRVGLTIDTKAGPVWNGQVRFNEQWLTVPLKWRRPRKIFVCAHGDLFHENVPDEWIDQVFAVMALAGHHIFQVLTKRPERMRQYLSNKANWMRVAALCNELKPSSLWNESVHQARYNIGLNWYLPNVWLGVSVEDQIRADERIPNLQATPAAVRWLSMEPLLGPVSLLKAGAFRESNSLLGAMRGEGWHQTGVNWIVLGGESGPGARPMHPDWARSVRDQCAAAGVPFLFKQWGDFHPSDQHDDRAMKCPDTPEAIHISGRREFRPSEQFRLICEPDNGWAGMCHVGKKRAGRLLDGVQHDGFPEAHHVGS